LERDKGKALAAHSTLNRLELSAEAIDVRYHKIQAQPDEIEQLLIKRGVKAIPRKSAEIVLDADATDDPLHGSQQGAYFHGYYRHYCYLPLYCFCGNIPLFAKLRDCKRDVRRRIICESFSAIYEWWRISLCSTIVCCRGLRPKPTVC
jgi:hypothetical protein